MEKPNEKPNIRGAIATFILGTAALTGFQEFLDRTTPEPPPAQTRDVNGDGLEDKIVQKRAVMDLLTGELRLPFYIDEVFYGVYINGQRVYVAEKVYNSLMEQRQKNQ